MVARERMGTGPVQVHDPELLVAALGRDEGNARPGHARLPRELEHDVVGELVHERTPVGNRPAVDLRQDRAPRREVAHLALQRDLAPSTFQRPPVTACTSKGGCPDHARETRKTADCSRSPASTSSAWDAAGAPAGRRPAANASQ